MTFASLPVRMAALPASTGNANLIMTRIICTPCGFGSPPAIREELATPTCARARWQARRNRPSLIAVSEHAIYPSSGLGSTSDQRDDFPLRFGIGLDVPSGRPQARMTRKLLNVAQTAADFADFAGGAGDETSPARMRRAAHHAEAGIQAVEPDDDGSSR